MRCDGKGVSKKEASLRAYVEGLSEVGASVAPPRALRAMAAEVLRACRSPAHLEPADLVSELTLRLLERIRAGQAPVGEVDALGPVLQHRLRQIAVEQAPSRRVLKELAHHVRRALEEPPAETAARPEFLDREGRFIHDRVRAAVAWAQGRGDAPREAGALSRWLASEFALLIEVDAAPESLTHAETPQPGVAGLLLARVLSHRLDATVMTVLRMRLSGAPLREIGERLGCGISTAHAECGEAQARLGAELLELDASPADVGEALELLAQARPTGGASMQPVRRLRRRRAERFAA